VLGQCKLCGRDADLRLSHIFPRFAVKWLKKTSATGYVRNVTSTRRQQETKREYLLCGDCEERLSRDEKTFCEVVFLPYHECGQQAFEYGPWLRRFLAGLHWKVLVTRNPKDWPENAEQIYTAVEVELREFLLEQSPAPGRAEFHIFFADVLEDADPPLPAKTNWYLARAFDATPTYSESGVVCCYAKLLKLLTWMFLTPRNLNKENWQGTLVLEQGRLQTPQTIHTAGMGPFLVHRIAAIEQAESKLSREQIDRIMESATSNPGRLLSSESYRVHRADRELRQRQTLRSQARKLGKGRDRNQPCSCGSGLKFKKCCARLGR